MALTNCKNCGKEISSNSEQCVHCGACTSYDNNVLNETNKVVHSLLTFASLAFWALIILGGILILVGVNSPEESLLIVGILVIIFGKVIEITLKWCAYVLQHLQIISNR